MVNREFKEELLEIDLKTIEKDLEDIKVFEGMHKAHGMIEKHLEINGYMYTIQKNNEKNELKYFKRKLNLDEMTYSDNINKFFYELR